MTFAVALAWSILQQEEPVTLQLRSGETIDGHVTEADSNGLLVRVPDAAGGHVEFVPWSNLTPENEAALRGRFLGEVSATPSTGPAAGSELTVPGVRVTLSSGETIVGAETALSDSSVLRLRATGGTRVIPRDEIVRQETVQVPIQVLFTPEEIIERLTGADMPSTPDDYGALAEQLRRIGLEPQAEQMLRLRDTLARQGSTAYPLHRAIERLKQSLPGAEAQARAFRAQQALLDGNFTAALEGLASIAEVVADGLGPDLSAELERIRGEVRQLQEVSFETRVVEEWESTAGARIELLALDRDKTLAEVVAAVRSAIPHEVRDEVATRLGFTPGDLSVLDAWLRRPASRRRIHEYGDATWVVAALESQEARDWWAAADGAARKRLLLGLYVETNLTVLRVETQNCPACGAAGTVRGLRGEVARCPSCRGGRELRVVVYR